MQESAGCMLGKLSYRGLTYNATSRKRRINYLSFL